MSKIYLERFFSAIFHKHPHTQIANYCQYNFTNWINFLPDDCDVVGISFYKNDYNSYIDIIDRVLIKTKKLLINISEPTTEYLLEFIEKIDNPKIRIFTDIIANTDKFYKFKTKVSWFIDSTNYYAEYDWAKNLLYEIQLPRSWQPRPKTFDCLLGSIKSHRNLIEKFYLQSSFKDKIDFNYYRTHPSYGIWNNGNQINFEINQRFGNVDISKFAIVPYYIYNNSYYSIVSETTAFNSFNQYTEKIAKPILARRPFVAFCGQYYLRNLRSLGFKTFGQIKDMDGNIILDESYDLEENNLKRWTMAWEQVEKMCLKDPVLTYAQFAEVLDYNVHHFLTTNWHQEILNELLTPIL